MATIVKKNDWYYLKWYDLDGTQKWRATGTKNRREALEHAKKLTQEIKFYRQNKTALKSTNKNNIPLRVLVEEFRKHLVKRGEQGSLSKDTLDSYLYYERRFELFLTESGRMDQGIKALGRTAMSDYVDFLSSCHPKSGGRKHLEDSNIKRAFWMVGVFIDFISDENGLNVDVKKSILKIPLPKSKKPKNTAPKHLTREQVKYLIEIPVMLDGRTAERDRLILLTFFNTGLRNAELRNLKVQDINFEKGQISVIGKGNKHRLIPMTANLSEELKVYIKKHDIKDSLFITMGGYLIQKSSFRTRLNAYEKIFLQKYPEAGHIHPHMFRHTAITLMLEAGIPVEVVKEIAGHSKISTTMVYTHVTQNRMKEEIKKFGV